LTMERLGGHVSHVSEEGKDSTFVVTLPIAA
jgi:signal transduction histidine kinase